ncbi:MAG: DUF600 family protein [Romboutsia sp.]|nr:DUF600 family protein [Romboutsia sp.]
MYYLYSSSNDVNFDYKNISNEKFSLKARHVIWEYNVLKKQFTDSYSKNVLDRYSHEN